MPITRWTPLPQKVTAVAGKPFILDASTKICCTTADALLMRDADFLSQYIRQTIGLELPVSRDATCRHLWQSDFVCLLIAISKRRRLSPDRDLQAHHHCWCYCGWRILWHSQDSAQEFARHQGRCRRIDFDARRGHRWCPALRLSRAWCSTVPVISSQWVFVKEFIDILALHGLNTFHWHLTDDQGWRIEIKAIRDSPRSVRSAAARLSATTRRGWRCRLRRFLHPAGRERHRGLAMIVLSPWFRNRHAWHAMAALAYPELGCTGGPYQVGAPLGRVQRRALRGQRKNLWFRAQCAQWGHQSVPVRIHPYRWRRNPTVRWDKCPSLLPVQHEGETVQGISPKLWNVSPPKAGTWLVGMNSWQRHIHRCHHHELARYQTRRQSLPRRGTTWWWLRSRIVILTIIRQRNIITNRR